MRRQVKRKIGELIKVVSRISLVFLGVVGVASSIAVIAGLGWLIFPASYNINRDINAHLELARRDVNADNLCRHLTDLRNGMEDYGMTEGSAALIFKTPNNDMTEIYGAVVEIQTEACELAQREDLSEEVYRITMDQLLDRLGRSGTEGGFEIPAYQYYINHTTEGLVAQAAFGIGGLVALAAPCLAVVSFLGAIGAWDEIAIEEW